MGPKRRRTAHAPPITDEDFVEHTARTGPEGGFLGKKIDWEEFVVQKLGHSVEVCPKTAMQARLETAEGPTFIQFIPEASCRRPVVIDGILVLVDIDAEAQGPNEKLQQ
jgi:hypothetical protein